MQTGSLWNATAELPRFPKLEGDLTVPVLVIGGGMAGLLCAWALREAGVDCALVEADRICGGVTGNTTAKVTFQHGLLYRKLIRKLGTELAGQYLTMNRKALDQIRQLCRDIPCDFDEKGGVVYSRSDRGIIEEECEALERLGCPAQFLEQVPLPFSVAGAVRVEHQGQFHPLKFAAGIAPGLRIYENTPVRQLGPGTAVTDRGTIRAEKIIVATHFPILNKHGSYFLKMYQHRSYVLALENAPDVDGMYVDEAEKGISFRNSGDLLLVGGGDHRTGKEGGGWEELTAFVQKAYPQAREQYRWATQDCMTLDGAPYIGPYSSRTQGLYVATGFNKWGMTSSMAAAMLLRDMILERDNPCGSVFLPSRSILHPQLAANGWEAVVNLLTPTPRRCPHMGCALKWNRQEHTWDCPCHGSRFTKEGKLLDNPATGNLKQKRGDDPV